MTAMSIYFAWTGTSQTCQDEGDYRLYTPTGADRKAKETLLRLKYTCLRLFQEGYENSLNAESNRIVREKLTFVVHWSVTVLTAMSITTSCYGGNSLYHLQEVEIFTI